VSAEEKPGLEVLVDVEASCKIKLKGLAAGGRHPSLKWVVHTYAQYATYEQHIILHIDLMGCISFHILCICFRALSYYFAYDAY
jgi:hypothetical protein